MKNLPQKVLTTDMRDSRSWTEILIFNHHLPGPLTSCYKFLLTKTYLKEISLIKFIVYYTFLLTKTPSIVNFLYDNIVYIKCLSKTDSNCPIVIFVSLCLSLPYYDTTLHIAVISILSRDHTFFLKLFPILCF